LNLKRDLENSRKRKEKNIFPLFFPFLDFGPLAFSPSPAAQLFPGPARLPASLGPAPAAQPRASLGPASRTSPARLPLVRCAAQHRCRPRPNGLAATAAESSSRRSR